MLKTDPLGACYSSSCYLLVFLGDYQEKAHSTYCRVYFLKLFCQPTVSSRSSSNARSKQIKNLALVLKNPETVLSRIWLAVPEKVKQGNLEFHIFNDDIVPRILIIHTVDTCFVRKSNVRK